MRIADRSGPRARLSLVSTRLAAPAAFALVGFAATTGVVVILGPDAASADAPTYPLALATSSQPASFTGPGQTLTLSYVVTNNGDKTLYGVAVQDALAGLSPVACPDGPLTAGTSKTCTATYVTTQGDFDKTFITDVSTATGIIESEGTIVTSPPANLTIPDDQPTAPLAATEPDAATIGSTPAGPDGSLPVDSVAEGKAAEAGPVAAADPAPAAARPLAPWPLPAGEPLLSVALPPSVVPRPLRAQVLAAVEPPRSVPARRPPE